MSDGVSRPFPLMVEVELLDRLSDPVREGRAKSVSGIIRAALERYDFSSVVVVRPNVVQISVRLPAEIRKNLRKTSRKEQVSVGQLVRSAVEAYLPQLDGGPAGQLEMPISVPEAPEEKGPAPLKVKRKPTKRKVRPKAKTPARKRRPANTSVKKSKKAMTRKRKG